MGVKREVGNIASRYEHTIPEGYEARIEGNKVIIELKEGEDEQHRKWILEYLYDGLRKSDEQFKDQFKSAIAWLEEQSKQKPIEWSKKDKEMVECCIKALKFFEDLGKHAPGLPRPNYFEIDSIIYPEDVINWLESLKFHVSPQDIMSYDDFEKVVGYLVQDIVANEHKSERTKQPTKVFVKKYYELLKVKPLWRPSEEQMNELDAARHNIIASCETLTSLYNDLRALGD